MEGKQEYMTESVESLKEGGVHFTNCTSVFQIDRAQRLYTISPSYFDKLAWMLYEL